MTQKIKGHYFSSHAYNSVKGYMREVKCQFMYEKHYTTEKEGAGQYDLPSGF